MFANFISLSLFLFSFIGSISNDIDSYFQNYRKGLVASYNAEQIIIHNNNLESLIEKLTPYYNDSVTPIRQKAYYLTFKKSMQADANKQLAVSTLLSGCIDNDGGLVGQNIEYLKNFQVENFNDQAVQYINSKLSNHRIPHYSGFVQLAGFVNTGKDILFQKLLDNSISQKLKWKIALALARMGDNDQIKYCMGKIKELPLNDAFVSSLIPDLIYMRQKESVDFCVSIIKSNEKLCNSLNPDISEKIICGYRVLEMLAPIIIEAPFIVDQSGFLQTSNPEKTLEEAKRWFETTPNYQIRKNIY